MFDDEVFDEIPEYIPVFDKEGYAVAWLTPSYFYKGAYVIYDLEGEAVGLVKRDGSVYNLDGDHVGWFEDGYFWDFKGLAVAFTKDAKGGPVIPGYQIPPGPPAPSVQPLLPATYIFAPLPAKVAGWSELSWKEFLKGDYRYYV